MNMLFWGREYLSKDAVKVSAPQWLWSRFYQGCADLHIPGRSWVWNSSVQIGLMFNSSQQNFGTSIFGYISSSVNQAAHENYIVQSDGTFTWKANLMRMKIFDNKNFNVECISANGNYNQFFLVVVKITLSFSYLLPIGYKYSPLEIYQMLFFFDRLNLSCFITFLLEAATGGFL